MSWGQTDIMSKPEYKRVLLKISGEALMGEGEYGIDAATVANIALQIKRVVGKGIQVAVVVGGGNIWRGVVLQNGPFIEVTKVWTISTNQDHIVAQRCVFEKQVLQFRLLFDKSNKIASMFFQPDVEK